MFNLKISKTKFNNKEINSVSSRDIHEDLGVKTQYSKWIEKRIKEYEFIENSDFIAISQKKLTAQSNITKFKMRR